MVASTIAVLAILATAPTREVVAPLWIYEASVLSRNLERMDAPSVAVPSRVTITGATAPTRRAIAETPVEEGHGGPNRDTVDIERFEYG